MDEFLRDMKKILSGDPLGRAGPQGGGHLLVFADFWILLFLGFGVNEEGSQEKMDGQKKFFCEDPQQQAYFKSLKASRNI